MRKIIPFIIVIGLIGATIFIVAQRGQSGNRHTEQAVEQPPTTRTEEIVITEGDTFSTLFDDTTVGAGTVQQWITATADIYDVAKIRQGQTVTLVYDIATDQLQQLVYPINTEEELIITAQVTTAEDGTAQTTWAAERVAIDYEVRVKEVSGTIDSSLYVAALAQGIDERAVIAFGNVFEWEIDFAWQVRQGDQFTFIYEERYRDGQYIMPGAVIAGKFVNAGQSYYAFGYTDATGEAGYYDEAGESIEKVFLKAPLAFKYISSGYTTGRRYVSAFNVSTGHRAIDYAAATGTPVRSVGNGTVTFAGWNGPYGNMISVRHNSTYQTNYAHLSRINVRYGQQVSQSDVIGLVGSTGFSTGPHLHYEMVKNGVKINPLTEELPSSEGLAAEQVDDYLAFIAPLKERLDR